MRQSARFKSKMITMVTGVMLLAGLTFGAGSASAADTSILKAPKLGVTSDGGQEIDPAYSFVPQVTSATKLVTYGSSLWRTTTWSDTDDRKFRSIALSNPKQPDSLKGNIGATYTNVGFYKGQPVDLRIKVTGWSRWGQEGVVGTAARMGNISFEEKNIAVSTQGYSYVDMTWAYMKAGTSTPIAVSGYFTFSDIDVHQSLRFSATSSKNIHKYLVADRNNLLKYSGAPDTNGNPMHKFYDTTDVDVNDKVFNNKYAFTFLYGNLTTFSLRWQTDWSKTKNASIRGGELVTPDRLYYLNPGKYAGGEYLFFVINKPTRTKMPDPVKTVSPKSGFTLGDKLTYSVAHEVPQEDPAYYHTSYVMTDTLDKALKNPKVTVRNSNNDNLNYRFDITTTNGVVKASAKPSFLKSKGFYGDTYRVIIEAEVDRAKLVAGLGSGSTYNIKNKATIKTNTGTYTTNEVSTPIAKRVLTVRHVDDATNNLLKTTNKVVFEGENYTEVPLTNLKKGSVPYKATSPLPKTGVIGKKNVTVEFRYILPSLDVGIEKIEIYTDKTDSAGLRTDVVLASHLPGAGSLEDDLGGKVKLEVVDTSNTAAKNPVYTNTWDVDKVPSTLNMMLPADYLTKGKKVNYDFNLTIPEAYSVVVNVPVTEDNPSGTDYILKLRSTTEKIKTHGYSSSEKKLTAIDENNQITYEGVVKTVKEGKAPVLEFNESLVVTVPELPKQKTGYGFTAGVDATYMNELRNMYDVKMAFVVDSDLIDSHLNYPEAGDLRRVDLEQTVTKASADTKSVATKHELPRVKVERYTGNLFTFKQVDEKDAELGRDPSNIYNYADGGRKLYAPIWAQLGIYDYGFISTESVGVHAVTIDVTRELNIYAHMFNHADSPTEQDDELLLHPLEQMTDSELAEWPLGKAPDDVPES